MAAATTIGVNPKINNMNQGYKAAKYNLLWICDSNIRGNLTVWFKIQSNLLYATPLSVKTQQLFTLHDQEVLTYKSLATRENRTILSKIIFIIAGSSCHLQS